ncbi:hypothetical protein GE09DRAFT_1061980 [Coniochaeta sp. 2T2.1]|nr:hypothetical protein GE09DRAFT_1061980 [Coniochaeta sp. 2T2.1]
MFLSQWPSLKTKRHHYQELNLDGGNEKPRADTLDNPEHGPALSRLPGLNKDTRRKLFIIACVSGLVLTIFGAIFLSKTHHPSVPSEPLADTSICGKTAAEARNAGCSWDQLMWAWYPPNCPHYANDAFLSADNWKFFSDPWGTEATDLEWEKGLNNELQLFSRHGEHLTHCLFFFLSVGQVLRDGTPATPKLRNYEHLQHCVKMIPPVVRSHANYSLINTKTPAVSYEEYC